MILSANEKSSHAGLATFAISLIFLNYCFLCYYEFSNFSFPVKMVAKQPRFCVCNATELKGCVWPFAYDSRFSTQCTRNEDNSRVLVYLFFFFNLLCVAEIMFDGARWPTKRLWSGKQLVQFHTGVIHNWFRVALLFSSQWRISKMRHMLWFRYCDPVTNPPFFVLTRKTQHVRVVFSEQQWAHTNSKWQQNGIGALEILRQGVRFTFVFMQILDGVEFRY